MASQSLGHLHRRHRLTQRGEDVVRIGTAEFSRIGIKRGADAAEELELGDRLALRRERLMDSLHAILEIGEGAFLLRMNGAGEKDVGGFGEWMIRVPRNDDEELRG